MRIFIVLLLFCASFFKQGNSCGIIKGTLVDSKIKKSLPKLKVDLYFEKNKINTTVSDSMGKFTFTDLDTMKTYRLILDNKNYQKLQYNDIKVFCKGPTLLEIKLHKGNYAIECTFK